LNFHTNVLQDINTFEKIAHLVKTSGKGRDQGMYVYSRLITECMQIFHWCI
jgi:hypothetical protein